MRNLTFLIPVVLLTGCSVINAFTMSKYDTGEHTIINSIRSLAEVSKETCTSVPQMKSLSKELYVESVKLKNYTSSLKENKEAATMAASLLDITKGLYDKYQKEEESVSELYCTLKLTTIENSSKAIQYSLARKPR